MVYELDQGKERERERVGVKNGTKIADLIKKDIRTHGYLDPR